MCSASVGIKNCLPRRLKPHPPPMVLQPAPNKKEADQEAEALKANLKSKLAELEKEVGFIRIDIDYQLSVMIHLIIKNI